MAAPITAASCCTPIQPLQATCYQTVPVTTYAQVKQTVEVPRYETAMEEREVTVYRPAHHPLASGACPRTAAITIELANGTSATTRARRR